MAREVTAVTIHKYTRCSKSFGHAVVTITQCYSPKDSTFVLGHFIQIIIVLTCRKFAGPAICDVSGATDVTLGLERIIEDGSVDNGPA